MGATFSNEKTRLKTIQNGKGIQFILNAAYEALGNPMLMRDMEYRLLAHSEGVLCDDPIWNETVARGEFSCETIGIFKEEGFIDAMANAKTAAYLSSPRLKYDRLLGKIFNKENILVAVVHLVACDRPLQDADEADFEIVCKKLSCEIAESSFYHAYGKICQEMAVKKLIEGSIANKSLYAGQISDLYDGLKDYIYVAVMDISKYDPSHTRLAHFRDLCKRAQSESVKYAIYANYVVALLSTDNAALDVKEDMGKLNRLFKQKDVYVGISGRFENLYDLSKYYTQALSALPQTPNGPQHIFLYEETT